MEVAAVEAIEGATEGAMDTRLPHRPKKPVISTASSQVAGVWYSKLSGAVMVLLPLSDVVAAG